MKNTIHSKLMLPALLTSMVLLVSCSGSDEPSSDSTNEPNSSDGQQTIAFIQGVSSDTFYQTQMCAMRDAAENAGYKFIFGGASEFNPQAQTPILQSIALEKPDVLVIDPTDKVAMAGPVQQVSDQGIPVMITSNDLDSDIPFAYVSAEQKFGGVIAAQRMVEILPDGGQIAIIGFNTTDSASVKREDGFREEMEKQEQFTLLPTEYNPTNAPTEAAKILAALLLAQPDIVGIFVVAEGTANGVASHLAAADRTDIKTVAFDASPTEAEQVINGVFDSIISQNPSAVGQKAIEITIAYLNGEKIDVKEVTITPVLITLDNINTPEGQAALYKPCS